MVTILDTGQISLGVPEIWDWRYMVQQDQAIAEQEVWRLLSREAPGAAPSSAVCGCPPGTQVADPSLLSLQGNAWWGLLSWPHQLRLLWPDLWFCPVLTAGAPTTGGSHRTQGLWMPRH